VSDFTLSFTAAPDDIDELGHVNNAVWVRWIQEVAVAHWFALATAEQHAAAIWVVIRHEIDYLRPLHVGATVTGRTWIPDPPRGARFARAVEFTGADGKVHVRARTTWAMLDRASGRPLRVTPELAALFHDPENRVS
jgi:acyl-CoA thioester hydrolase